MSAPETAENPRLGLWRDLGLRTVEGLPIRVVERLPEPDPREHVLDWNTGVVVFA